MHCIVKRTSSCRSRPEGSVAGRAGVADETDATDPSSVPVAAPFVGPADAPLSWIGMVRARFDEGAASSVSSYVRFTPAVVSYASRPILTPVGESSRGRGER